MWDSLFVMYEVLLLICSSKECFAPLLSRLLARRECCKCSKTSHFIIFGKRKSFQIHICIILKQSLNTPLHLSLQQKLRLQKSKVFERNYCVFRKSPRISPKGHQNKRTKESASHHILLRHQRHCSNTPKHLEKTSRTASGRTCRHAQRQVISLSLGTENHSKFIFALS